jgi:hypothetical protein
MSCSRENFCYKVPFVNSLYDEFVDEPLMSTSRINDLITATTLLSGLFLGAVCAIPMSVDFDEVSQARERFKTSPYNSTRWKDDAIISELAAYTSASVYTLGSAMASIVVFYLFSGMETSNDENTPREIRQSWWSYNRYIILFIVMSTLSGMVISFLAFNRFAFMKFPDLFVENGGKMVNGSWSTVGRGVDIPSVRTSTYGALLSWGYFYLMLSIIANWAIMSCSRCNKFQVEHNVYVGYKQKMSKWNIERNKIIMYLSMITKIWDMSDGLSDDGNPFLISLDENVNLPKQTKVAPNSEERFEERFEERCDWEKDNAVSVRHNDIRVNKAFEIIQAANYCKWEIFLKDFKNHEGSDFKDLSARWRRSLRTFPAPETISFEQWKQFDQKGGTKDLDVLDEYIKSMGYEIKVKSRIT